MANCSEGGQPINQLNTLIQGLIAANPRRGMYVKAIQDTQHEAICDLASEKNYPAILQYIKKSMGLNVSHSGKLSTVL